MGKRNNDNEEDRKALTLWESGDEAGEPVACIASTFTFRADFFEKECLGRFLHMETDPDLSEELPYLIERLEKFKTTGISVLVDRRHAYGKQTLYWDVVPIIRQGAAQHAKVSVMCWQNLVRVVIGSGNLTPEGYRTNLEVFGKIEAWRDRPSDLISIRETLDFLDRMLSLACSSDLRESPRQRCADNLQRVRTLIKGWPNDNGKPFVTPIFGGLDKNIVQQIEDRWPSAAGLRTNAYVVSPFFDSHENCAEMIAGIDSLLAPRKRESLRLFVKAYPGDSGRIRVRAPKALVDAAASSFGECDVHAIKIDEGRELHAKMLTVQSDSWGLTLLGSSNFTRAGYGISKHSNLEANLAYVYKLESDNGKQLREVWPENDEVDLSLADFDPIPVEEGEKELAPVLPSAFRDALFDAGDSPQLILILGDNLPVWWTIEADGRGTVLSSSNWAGGEREFRYPWKLPAQPASLQVSWRNADVVISAEWSVNVLNRSDLPAPDQLKDLELDTLMAILGSKRPLHEAATNILKGQQQAGTNRQTDPHRLVKTDAYLLRRTARIAVALDHLKERLEKPVLNIEALMYRLDVPVGVMAFAHALQREFISKPSAIPFFLAELALTLKRVDVAKSAAGELSVKTIREQLHLCVNRIKSLVGETQSAGLSKIDEYVTDAFTEALK